MNAIIVITRRAAISILVLAIAIVLTTLLRPDFIVGAVESIRWTSDGVSAVAVVRTATGSRAMLLAQPLGARLSETAWLVARGTPRRVDSHPVLDVRRLATIESAAALGVLDTSVADLLVAAAQYRRAGILTALVILLVSVFAARAAGCLAMGLAGALVVWHAVAIARIDEWIPYFPSAGPIALVIGFLCGVLLAVKPTTPTAPASSPEVRS